MGKAQIDRIYSLIEKIPVTSRNKAQIDDIKELIEQEKYVEAINKIEELNNSKTKIKGARKTIGKTAREEKEEANDGIIPKKLSNIKLEHIFLGLLLTNPK